MICWNTNKPFTRCVTVLIILKIGIIALFYFGGFSLEMFHYSPSIPLDDREVLTLHTDENGDIKHTHYTIIAIGMGLTTRNVKLDRDVSVVNSSILFFKVFLPSLCLTVSDGYYYAVYIAYDYNDPLLSDQHFKKNFLEAFHLFVHNSCPNSSSYSLHFVNCNYTGKPAWAQNDAMIEAYMSGADYFYRVNDDTLLKTANWTETFISTLEQLDPPRVGVVGPNHRGGNTKIMTFDFTHRTHVDIHGFYYPRDFVDWYADGWITRVYQPGRSIKVAEVSVVHAMQLTRYKYHRLNKKNITSVIERDRQTLSKYLLAKESAVKLDPRRVISMSYKQNSSHYWGLVRNAQLAPVIFPGWTLRVYVTNTSLPDKISRTLVRLGAVVKTIPDDIRVSEVSRDCLSYLVADDPDVDVFLMRNADERLSERDAAAVQDWLNQASGDQFVHVIKDQPHLNNNRLVRGQWGAKTKPLRTTLNQSMKYFVQSQELDKSGDCDTFLIKELDSAS